MHEYMYSKDYLLKDLIVVRLRPLEKLLLPAALFEFGALGLGPAPLPARLTRSRPHHGPSTSDSATIMGRTHKSRRKAMSMIDSSTVRHTLLYSKKTTSNDRHQIPNEPKST